MPALDHNPANLARYLFCEKDVQDFYADWEHVARDMVAALRMEAGRNPYERALTDQIGELTTRSDAFPTWWAAHNVHTTATKTMHHPVVGDAEVRGEALELTRGPRVTIIAYTVEPTSPSEERLRLLASWATSTVTETDNAPLTK